MQIIVGSKSYEVDSSTSVETLLYQIENKEFLPVGSFRLLKGSVPMDDINLTLESYGIEEDEELSVTLQVPAGMRKKWKKKRMRRLRRKRRKMRQRAR
jgi:ubiquitin-small subunit ribosomal protein S27Ae